jgi:hypothetical protein
MKSSAPLLKSLLCSATVFAATLAAPAAETGKPAPAFELPDVKGAKVSLAALRGKVVVIEWINFDCPFVKKHYVGGNMPSMQVSAAQKGAVWLSVSTFAPGKGMGAQALAARAAKEGGKAAHVLMDEGGAVGRAYGAKTTPHMFIIGTDGTLLYDGAIDSVKSVDAADVAKAEKLFANALEAVLSGKAVANAKNAPYGCSVKY